MVKRKHHKMTRLAQEDSNPNKSAQHLPYSYVGKLEPPLLVILFNPVNQPELFQCSKFPQLEKPQVKVKLSNLLQYVFSLA